MGDMPRRAYSYLRFSHPKQATGDTIRRQEEWTASLCRRHSWYLDDTLRFADKGRSAFHGGLKALGQFRDLVRRERIAPGSVLVVEVLDRISREEVDDAYDIFREIIRAGIWIATREPERIYTRETCAGNMLNLLEPLFIFARAHDESRAKSMRIREAWVHQHRKAREEKQPIQSRPPWWLRKGQHGYELIPEHAEAIRQMRTLCLSGHGYTQTAGELARRLFRPPGRNWCIETIRSTLKSRRTLGEHQPGHKIKGRLVPDGPPIQGYYPTIFTPEEWEAIQGAIQRRQRNKPGRPAKECANLFTGLVFEANSRLPMSKGSARPQHGGKKYNSLKCRNAYYGMPLCRVPYESRRGQPGFEGCVLDTIAMLRPQDVLDDERRSDEREHRIDALTKRVTALAHRRGQLQAAAADPEQDAADILPALATVRRELETAAKELNALKLESQTGRAEALAECQTLQELRQRAQGEERQELDRRIKAALPSIMESIWIQCQRVSTRHQIVHIQIWLHSGSMRYVQMLPPNLHGVKPWQLEEHDLRKGHYVGDATNMAQPA